MSRGEDKPKRRQFSLLDLMWLVLICACASLAFRELGFPATAMMIGAYFGGQVGSWISGRWYVVVGFASLGAIGTTIAIFAYYFLL